MKVREVKTMIIDLPKKFSKRNEKLQEVVYVENGNLFLRNDVPFKHLMFELTYSIYGKKQCNYCGKEIKNNEITVDHIIPQTFGGPDITNNLIPYCRECNTKKDSMLLEQFKAYSTLQDQEQKKEYRKNVLLENEKLKYDKDFSFLGDWVERMNISVIRGYQERINYSSSDKNQMSNKRARIDNFYHTYGRLQKPIILDRKKRLLSGYESLMYCKRKKITEVPVIVLENVEIFY